MRRGEGSVEGRMGWREGGDVCVGWREGGRRGGRQGGEVGGTGGEWEGGEMGGWEGSGSVGGVEVGGAWGMRKRTVCVCHNLALLYLSVFYRVRSLCKHTAIVSAVQGCGTGAGNDGDWARSCGQVAPGGKKGPLQRER